MAYAYFAPYPKKRAWRYYADIRKVLIYYVFPSSNITKRAN